MKVNNLIVGTAVTGCRIADPDSNSAEIRRVMESNADCDLLVFPDLCITGSTCGDLFRQRFLLEKSRQALYSLKSASFPHTAVVGFPMQIGSGIYDCAAVIKSGEWAGIVPLRLLHGECAPLPEKVLFDGVEIPLGKNTVFPIEDRRFAIITEKELLQGEKHPEADICVCLDTRPDEAGRRDAAEQQTKAFSGANHCTIVYVTCSPEESTTDSVYPGRMIAAKNGTVLSIADWTDLPYCMKTMLGDETPADTLLSASTLVSEDNPYPFLDPDPVKRRQQSSEILNLQARGLYMRMKKTGIRTMVLGVSGGLDSTLALLVCDQVIKLDPSLRIVGVTMPSKGNTSDRTKDNALSFMDVLGIESREIPIHDELVVHLRSIGHPEHYAGSSDVVYENAQARIRTLILMDIANMENGLVVGTGDLSEIALGWCTYSGDQMSMYGVNGSVPKTQVRAVCRDTADTCGNEALKEVLYSIIDTPISPELTPNRNGTIQQKTEDHVGDYAINDYYLYWMVKEGKTPAELLAGAQKAFPDQDRDTLKEHLKRFIKRFFTQQFKRSCSPDGAKAGILSLSPRTDWHMPSDADASLFLSETDRL
ncbi:MAG: NAD(+) synthase [Solobacterium sp.]|nr:NAD(+) synthase [Solobacterium sp.]